VSGRMFGRRARAPNRWAVIERAPVGIGTPTMRSPMPMGRHFHADLGRPRGEQARCKWRAKVGFGGNSLSRRLCSSLTQDPKAR